MTGPGASDGLSGESPLARIRRTVGFLARAPLEARFPFASPAAIERAQRRRVRAAVSHAYEHVPYYRETMRRRGLRPEDLTTADHLARLPLVEREDIQHDPERFVSAAQPRERYLELRSGGSTGEPLTVWYDQRAVLGRGLHRQRVRAATVRLAGRKLRYRVATIVPDRDASHPMRGLARRSLAPRLIAAPLTLSMTAPLAENLARLRAFEPDVLSSYGSYLEHLFLHLRRTGESFPMPRIAAYSSDSLSDSVRRLISGSFGVPVLSAYQAIEAYDLGLECERQRGLHLNVDLYPLRIVDSDGRERPHGESGEVVVSNLVNRGTVLLNYRLGDLARRLPGGCSCGRSLPLLSLPEGRRDDWIETVSGELLHPAVLRALLGREREVWSYQVAQEGRTRLRVSVVAAPGASRDPLLQRLGRALEGVLGAGLQVELRFVDTLPRTAGSKVRRVVIEDPQRRGSRHPR
jgi:phenylacetate-CoA ligase